LSVGFVNNYQNVEGLIQDAKVVTCLDSLYRVATRNFDYIIMDECVHVPALQQLVHEQARREPALL
jgi:superfamily II DNA or RNA helicase